MIEKIRKYLIENEIVDEVCRVNVDFLGENPTEFAIIPIAVNPILKKYIDGSSLRQYQFQLISCNYYGADVMQNMANSKFYEELYDKIESNNDDEILPDIKGIESIECLNNGAILDVTTNTARYSIQMKITYEK
ncbi:MAG TPA: chloramphenicol resistance protein [Firmicutes bacterium]|nr:chloramphenicol resistance protein [Bacillota bacterium]